MKGMTFIQRFTVQAASLAVLSLMAGVVMASCAPGQGNEPAAAASSAGYQPSIEAATENMGTCADASASNDTALVLSGLDGVAAALRMQPVPDIGQGDHARDPVPGLNVLVREVSSNSMTSPADQLVAAHLPGVPGLIDPPDPADFESFAERKSLWSAAQARSDAAASEAAAAGDDLMQQFAALQLTEGGSEIAGCLTALRDFFAAGEEVIAVVISDMQQVGVPQLHGDFSHMHVVVAHACVTAAQCDQSEADWRTVFADIGVASVVFVSVNQVDDELVRLLEVK